MLIARVIGVLCVFVLGAASEHPSFSSDAVHNTYRLPGDVAAAAVSALAGTSIGDGDVVIVSPTATGYRVRLASHSSHSAIEVASQNAVAHDEVAAIGQAFQLSGLAVKLLKAVDDFAARNDGSNKDEFNLSNYFVTLYPHGTAFWLGYLPGPVPGAPKAIGCSVDNVKERGYEIDPPTMIIHQLTSPC